MLSLRSAEGPAWRYIAATRECAYFAKVRGVAPEAAVKDAMIHVCLDLSVGDLWGRQQLGCDDVIA